MPLHIPTHLKRKSRSINMQIASAELTYRRPQRISSIAVQLRDKKSGYDLFIAPEYMHELLVIAGIGTAPIANVPLSSTIGQEVIAKFDSDGRIETISSTDGTLELDVR